ncbi:MAG TPA: hypothetical protein VM324_08960 [Egibacteraceae bacterium]|nr:hypothetical protein [Egibacteraceae bacterium]
MAVVSVRTSRTPVVLAVALLVVAGSLFGVGLVPAAADVSTVTGSAYGYHAYNLVLFDSPQAPQGPRPTVTLAADAANSPQEATAAQGDVAIGPATLFSSGAITVRTAGSVGANGSVTSSSDVANVNRGGSEVFDADRVQSTCTASEQSVTGGTTITNGTLLTHAQATDHDEGAVQIPASPPANHTVEGHLHLPNNLRDNFRFVFNEQVRNPDGSLTVNAVHAYYLGPTLTGELIIGQSVCGAGATTAPTTTTVPGATTTTTVPRTTTTTVPGATTTTTVPGATTTTVPGTTTVPTTPTTPTDTTPTDPTVPPEGGGVLPDDLTGGAEETVELAGRAFGFFSEVGLFGGPAVARGPEPLVELAADASNSPQNASVASGEAVYGPAVLFRSGRIELHTEGATGGAEASSRGMRAQQASSDTSGYVTSSSNIQGAAADQRPGPFLYDGVGSTCTVDADGVTAATTITGGVVETRYDPSTQAAVDTQQVPANPPPGHTVEGTIDHVGDSFRIVFNEQIRNGDGSITVNAVHMHLLGPTAVGELVIGQSHCAMGAAARDGSGTVSRGDAGTGRGAAAAGAGAGGRGQLARTGSDPLPLAVLGLGLLLMGTLALRSGRRRGAVDARRR